MKNFSVNLLKLGLLLILGLCVFSVGNEVEAGVTLKPTIYAYSGEQIEVFCNSPTVVAEDWINVYSDTNGGSSDYVAKKVKYDRDNFKLTIKLPENLEIHKIYYIDGGSAKYNDLYNPLYILNEGEKAVDSTQQETIYFYNRKSGDYDDFSIEKHSTFTDNHIYVNKLDEKGNPLKIGEKYILEKHIDLKNLKNNTEWKVEDITGSDGKKYTRFTCLSGAKRSDGKQWYYVWSNGKDGKGPGKWIQLTVVDYELVFIHPKNGEVKPDKEGYINLDKDTQYTLKVRQNGGNPININYWDTSFVPPATANDNYTKESWIKDITKYGSTTASNNDLEVGNTGSKINKLYEADYSNSTFTTLDMEAEFEYRIDRRRIYKLTNNLSAILTSAKIRIGQEVKDSGDNGGDNGGNNNPPPANTQPFEAGQKIKYSVDMNVRDNIRGKEIGELPANVVVEFIEFKDSYLKVKVKNPEGTPEERYIFYGINKGINYKEKVSTTSGEIGKYEYIVTSGNPETDPPPIGEIDLKLDGFMGIIIQITEMLIKFITEINWAETISLGTSIVGEIFSAITGS